MKKQIKNLCIFLTVIFFLSTNAYSQSDCGTEEYSGQAPYGNNFFGGYFKPERTDISNGSPSGSDATFNMLFVFIQFQDENETSDEWPIDSIPRFMNKFLVKNKNGSGDFWNRYRDSSLSDYYQELSRGAFHVTGEARHLITYRDWNYYKDSVGYNGLLTEIYSRLKADTTIQWLKFDQWSRNDVTNKYVNERDKYLDMMGLFFRDVIGVDFLIHSGAGGYVPLFGPVNFTVYASGNDTVKIGKDWTSMVQALSLKEILDL